MGKHQGTNGNLRKDHHRNLAKVEVVGSNPIARSNLFNGLIEYSGEPRNITPLNPHNFISLIQLYRMG